MQTLRPWLIVALIVLIGGMTWVQYRNQSVTSGRDIKKLEKQLAELNNDLEALRPKVNQLCSRTALQARLDDGFIKMIPLQQDRIVQVNFARDNAIRTVSNEGTDQ